MRSYTRDLRKGPPRSPAYLLGEYAILARCIDKCRAWIGDVLGDYDYNCPVDAKFFSFTGIEPDEFLDFVAWDHTDEEVLRWVREVSIPRTPEEIKGWNEEVAAIRDEKRKDSEFIKKCSLFGVDPERVTLFEYLDASDRYRFRASGD